MLFSLWLSNCALAFVCLKSIVELHAMDENEFFKESGSGFHV